MIIGILVLIIVMIIWNYIERDSEFQKLQRLLEKSSSEMDDLIKSNEAMCKDLGLLMDITEQTDISVGYITSYFRVVMNYDQKGGYVGGYTNHKKHYKEV